MRFRAVKEINGWLTDWKLGSRRGSWMRGGNGSTATRHTLGQRKAPGAARAAEGVTAAEERWGPGTVRETAAALTRARNHKGASSVRPSVSANGVNLSIGCALSELCMEALGPQGAHDKWRQERREGVWNRRPPHRDAALRVIRPSAALARTALPSPSGGSGSPFHGIREPSGGQKH